MKDFTCELCGKKLSENEITEFDGKVMCKHCLEEHTYICSNCGVRIWAEDNDGNSSTPLCSSCYDSHYTRCEDCGRLIAYDDALYIDDGDEPYCNSCYDRMTSERYIHDYGYKPEPIFYGDDKLYLGVELEIDIGGELDSMAEKILDVANFQCDHIYCKHDGSIEDGFEMVSHPMDLEYHQKEMPWQKVFEKAIILGYRSHQTSTCGLHVHVSRTGLHSNYEGQEDVISRIVYFIEAHWNELLKFSRRTESSINRWASRYGLSNDTKSTYDKAKKGNGMGRYVCLNLSNYSTIEFRIFRGTLKYETFVATLQLVHEICTKAIKMSDKDFESMCWSEFVRTIDKENKKELINYLKSKQLYVNEVTESEGNI